jgi:nitrogen fixation NifU-like protein
MAYSEKVLEHFQHPKNVGTLDKSKSTVGTGLVGAPECGDVMRLQIEVDPSTQTIIDAKFKTFGCGSAIASSSLATEWLKGKTIEQALTIDNMDIVEELAPPALDLKYINHRKVMFHWYDDELKPPVHGWFQGVICSAKKHGFNFCIKYDLEVTKNKHVNGVIGVNLSMSGENAYGLRWSIIKPINFIENIYSEVLKFTENHEDDEEKDH